MLSGHLLKALIATPLGEDLKAFSLSPVHQPVLLVLYSFGYAFGTVQAQHRMMLDLGRKRDQQGFAGVIVLRFHWQADPSCALAVTSRCICCCQSFKFRLGYILPVSLVFDRVELAAFRSTGYSPWMT